jgi:hypothetical protein
MQDTPGVHCRDANQRAMLGLAHRALCAHTRSLRP